MAPKEPTVGGNRPKMPYSGGGPKLEILSLRLVSLHPGLFPDWGDRRLGIGGKPKQQHE